MKWWVYAYIATVAVVNLVYTKTAWSKAMFLLGLVGWILNLFANMFLLNSSGRQSELILAAHTGRDTSNMFQSTKYVLCSSVGHVLILVSMVIALVRMTILIIG